MHLGRGKRSFAPITDVAVLIHTYFRNALHEALVPSADSLCRCKCILGILLHGGKGLSLFEQTYIR